MNPADRALWHLELCPELFYADQREQPDWGAGLPDDDDDGEYLGMVTCWACSGEGAEIRCCDDLCHGQDWCIHGDNYTCPQCGGDGFL